MFANKQIRAFLKQAVDQAEQALERGNYPIAAIVVDTNGTILATAQNTVHTDSDITAHAEIICIRQAGIRINPRETAKEHILFTSLEPCYGCSFFLARTNITKIYAALRDQDNLRGGMENFKKTPNFMTHFAHIELINEPYENLMKRSKQLMMQYFLSKGRKTTALSYGYSATH